MTSAAVLSREAAALIDNTPEPEGTYDGLDRYLAEVDLTREKSVMEQIARLPPAEQKAMLDGIDPAELIWDWSAWARPMQLLPSREDVSITLFAGGRGTGKTRSGSEFVRRKAREMPGSHGLLLTRTTGDARTLVSGESGILAVHPPDERPDYIPSRRMLEWPNGTTAILATSMEPSDLRGPQGEWGWADEIATFPDVPDVAGLTALQNLRVAVRLGLHPELLMTTTPKRSDTFQKLLQEALDPDSGMRLVRGRTADNIGYLARSYLETLWLQYGNTPLWEQELEGAVAGPVEGALWNEQLLAATRVARLPEHASRYIRIVSVDPSVSEKPRDECGIVVIYVTRHRDLSRRHAYVVEDASIQAPPDVWARAVADAARRHDAVVVAERNQGGALVRAVINSVEPGLPVFDVWASRGKALRAEPVVSVHRQRRVHLVHNFPQLEDQLTTWDPTIPRMKSPDRLDAFVHGIAAGMISPPEGLATAGAAVRFSNAADAQLQDATRGGVLLTAGQANRSVATTSGLVVPGHATPSLNGRGSQSYAQRVLAHRAQVAARGARRPRRRA